MRHLCALALLLLAGPGLAQRTVTTAPAAAPRRITVEQVRRTPASRAALERPTLAGMVAAMRQQAPARVASRRAPASPAAGTILTSPQTLTMTDSRWQGPNGASLHLSGWYVNMDYESVRVDEIGSLTLFSEIPPGDYIVRFQFDVQESGMVTITDNGTGFSDYTCPANAGVTQCSGLFTVAAGNGSNATLFSLKVDEGTRVAVRSVSIVRSPM